MHANFFVEADSQLHNLIGVKGYPKSISLQMVEFGCHRGVGLPTVHLSLMEWNLTRFSVIFNKALDIAKQGEKQPKKKFSLFTVNGFRKTQNTHKILFSIKRRVMGIQS